jgi:putative hydrolase of the HAD superfamily
MLSAITLDFWDTLYDGTTLTERVVRRSTAMRAFVASLGREFTDDEWTAHYGASGREAERWWREEHRGYVAADRIRWLLERLGLACDGDDPRLAELVREVDAALLDHPPALLPGADDAVRALAASGVRLAIVSDTGFASGAAQTTLLERDGLAEHFEAIVYSCDVGHAKPHPVPFRTALDTLGAASGKVLHVGDIERTDIAGALAAGMRAIRLDVVRRQGPSAAELVAESWDDVLAHVGVAPRAGRAARRAP